MSRRSGRAAAAAVSAWPRRSGACEQPVWMRTLAVGDVVSNGGPWRVVRRVDRRKNGDLWCVWLAIRHCSWTHRCYTLYLANDLKQSGYKRVSVRRRRLDGLMDRRIEEAMNQGGCSRSAMLLTCCDVEGVA